MNVDNARTAQFVCAMNRNRDNYQVPKALFDAGLLARFVTDFYAPDPAPAWLPGPLRRRSLEGLPSTATSNATVSFALQAAGEALRLPMRRIFAVTDRSLGRAAGRVARETRAHLYCYAGYLPPERAIQPGARRIVFEYHPLPALGWELLREDHGRFPETAWSFARERAAFDAATASSDWRRADAVVCASAMTRRSLEHAGCDPARITVVPYGTTTATTPVTQRRNGSPCEFIFVGQGVQRKGLHHLISAWQAAGPGDARLTLVCYDIDPGIAAMIRDPSIRLLGRQSRSDLDALLDGADVFVMPSLVEGFGLVYLEALARGCHVVGTVNTGLPDLRLPDHACTILQPGDLPGLAAALTRLRDDAVAGRFDRAAIAQAAAWRWSDFRASIAAHARGALA